MSKERPAFSATQHMSQGELDKRLNGETGFKHIEIDETKEVRLVRLSVGEPGSRPVFTLEAARLADLSSIKYRCLSYTWGQAQHDSDVRKLQIDEQDFFVRQNLYDFLVTAGSRRQAGLFFIDAICINQLSSREKECQVQEMARIFRHADQVIAWLGTPSRDQFTDVRALAQTKGRQPASWTAAQWAGFKYLSHHRYWKRIWIVQEVLLASSMVVWCGQFTFPLGLFGSAVQAHESRETKEDAQGRPSITQLDTMRLRSPADVIISHRTRQVLRPVRDVISQGISVGTLEEMEAKLRKPSAAIRSYQSRIPDPLHQAVRKFGKLECTDQRDRLYGLLGLVNDRTRAKINIDYTKGVDYAFYQALKAGLEELFLAWDSPNVSTGWQTRDISYLGYYSDVRDAFSLEEEQSKSILRQAIEELSLADALHEARNSRSLLLGDLGSTVLPGLETLLKYAGEDEESDQAPHYDGRLARFHERQRGMAGKL